MDSVDTETVINGSDDIRVIADGTEPGHQDDIEIIATPDLRQYGATNGAIAGAVFGLFFTSGNPILMLIVFGIVGAVAGATLTQLLARARDQIPRMGAAAVLGAAVGAVAGFALDDALLPALRSVPLVGWPIALAIIVGGFAWLRNKNPIRPALIGALVGWLIGGLGLPALGGGTRAEAIMTLAVVGALAGGVSGTRSVRRPVQPLRPVALFMAGLTLVGAAQLATTYGTADSFDKLITTVAGVFIAVAAFTGLWVGINLVFNLATTNWKLFATIIGGIIGFVTLAIIDGNRALQIVGPRQSVADGFDSLINISDPATLGIVLGAAGYLIGRAIDRYHGVNRYAPAIAVVGAVIGAVYGTNYVDELPGVSIIEFLWWPLIGMVMFGALGFAISRTHEPMQRLLLGVAAGTAIGLVLGFTLKTSYLPALKAVPLVAAPLVAAALGFGYAGLRRKAWLRPVLWFAFIGWIIGSLGVPDIGGGTRAEGILAFAVAGAILGAIVGSTKSPDLVGRTAIDANSRAWIFMLPALLFIAITLVIPSIITALLSLRDNAGDQLVWLENYGEIFTDESNFNLSNWTNIFGSKLLWLGLIIGAIGIGLAVMQGRRVGRSTDFTPQSGGIVALGIVFLSFAIFTTLRGTIINNLWWVFAVTAFSTGMGLAIAAWSDGIKGEKIAKSLIFMPMAISFVGASIIWRFMYRSQDISNPQTGVLNAAWVWLGAKTSGTSNFGIGIFQWEFFSFNARWVFFAALLALGLYLIYRGVKAYPTGGEASLVGLGLLGVVPLYLALRIAQGGIGGFVTNSAGEIVPSPVFFLEVEPFNNFWLMVVLLWIETGFSMVILSAAIKAVPADLIEAAELDGADKTQVFWRIIVPQIAPTIGVVVTTVIVRVTKVYDIVKVMTGGRSGTEVLANSMITEAFQFGNSGTGSALAIILFLSVLPIMYMNIRRMQKEAAQ